ncbi:MAG: hypothetical protein HYR76_09870 [Ignavibacteria bacterium]|nr:hypothetical protein [Ignavibacteria bacterium]MBI3765351.1 hypothetical protein [Ignavibacteriales bacterium]
MTTLQPLLIVLIVFIMVSVCSCWVLKGNGVDESAAAMWMRTADSLEAASAVHEAAIRYAMVAERFPGSRFYKTAVRKAAFLHSSPLNEAVDDSASFHWFHVYTSLPISKEEKESAEMYISLMKKIGTLQKEIENLTLSSKKQTAELTSRANRIHELEVQLQEATEELTKLRDIDVKAYKRGTKK